MNAAEVAARQTRRSARSRHRRNVVVGRLLVLAFVLALWQYGADARVLDPGTFASPAAIWSRLALWNANGTLWFHSWITIEETVVGFVAGTAAGIVLGFGIGSFPALAEMLDPFIIAVYSIPKVALAPLFLVWFGIGVEMKIILAAVTVVFIVFFNTLAGVRHVDRDLVDAVWLMGAKPRAILFKVIVPSAMGWALTGVRIAIPYALIGAIIGELIASNRGVGSLIATSASQYDTAGVFAALSVLTVMAVVLNAIVDAIDRRLSRWKPDASVNLRGGP